MIFALGFSSRLQEKSIRETYKKYINMMENFIDRDLGIVSSVEDVDEVKRHIEAHSVIIGIILSGGTRKIILRTIELGIPIILISSTKQNALASTLHALYIAKKNDSSQTIKIIHYHGDPWNIPWRHIEFLSRAIQRMYTLKNKHVLLVGVEKQFLETEKYDTKKLKEIFGIETDTIPINKLLDTFSKASPDKEVLDFYANTEKCCQDEKIIIKIAKLSSAIKDLLAPYIGGGISCFPIIKKVGFTPCIPVALSFRSKILACEADLASLITMILVKTVTGSDPFMANPEKIENNVIVLAHCTASVNLLNKITIQKHFETNLPYAVQGEFDFGTEIVTLIKISPSFNEAFVSTGRIVYNRNFSDEFCRNQLIIKTKDKNLDMFLEGTFSHHLVIVAGDYKDLFIDLFRILGIGVPNV